MHPSKILDVRETNVRLKSKENALLEEALLNSNLTQSCSNIESRILLTFSSGTFG